MATILVFIYIVLRGQFMQSAAVLLEQTTTASMAVKPTACLPLNTRHSLHTQLVGFWGGN